MVALFVDTHLFSLITTSLTMVKAVRDYKMEFLGIKFIENLTANITQSPGTKTN